jgi:glycerate kinase
VTGGRLTVLVAPDSFKGSLTSVEVARALAAGWSETRPRDHLMLAPLADGGEGTLEAIAAAGGWEARSASVRDPSGRPIEARWLASADGVRAVIEMAQASGLSRLAPAERDPVGATTAGTGELLAAALDSGARDIVMGIGGSATTDGGRGMLEALGARSLGPGRHGEGLDGLDERLATTRLRVACDVTNPLLGPHGAAATYGPQKGADEQQVAALDGRLAALADALDAATGRDERGTPGAGAAGGLGYALLSIQDRFESFGLRPGIDLVMEATGFDDKLAAADLVITGEGRIDSQTAFGKTAFGVARRASAAGLPCIAVGGGVTVEGSAVMGEVGAVAVPVSEGPSTVEEAMAAGVEPLVRCGRRLARLVTIGALLANETDR